MFTLLILSEAGKDIGFGHYTRCMGLKSHFESQGATVRMLTDYHPFDQEKPTQDIEHSRWRYERDFILSLADGYDGVLVDSYLAQTPDYRFLKQHFNKVLIIDDYDRIVYDADVLLNPNLYGDSLPYPQQQSKTFGGKDYVILREVFRSRVQQSVNYQDEARRVTITVGGSDIRQLLPVLTELSDNLGFATQVISGNAQLQQTLQAVFDDKPNVKVLGLLSAEQMYDAFSQADIIITAAGQTMHELASMGKAVIAVGIDDDQTFNLNFYHQHGFIQNPLLWHDPQLSEKIQSELMRLTGKAQRKSLGAKGKAIIDGKGVENIYHLFKGELTCN